MVVLDPEEVEAADPGVHSVLDLLRHDGFGVIKDHWSAEAVTDMWNADTQTLKTTKNESNAFDLDRRQLPRFKTLSVAAALEYEVQSWLTIERNVCRAGPEHERRFDLMFYIEAQSYDGVDLDLVTPARLRQQQFAVSMVEDFPEGYGTLAVSEGDGGVVLPLEECKGERNTGPTKVLQTESMVAMGIRSRRSSRWFILMGDRTVPLQFSDRSTGESLKAMLEEQHKVTPERELFMRKIRNTTTDRYEPNYIAEEEIVKARGKGWTSHHVFCHSHVASSLQKSTADVFPECRTGLNAWSRCLNVAGEMDKFRSTFAGVLWRKLRLEDRVDIDPDAVKYKALLCRVS